ncbi:MAG: glycosyltransferase family 2 protein [Betaproteobacteria bacterium]|nr:glycosyltransferase family 2 protein [Betaproteobacteria bacterium]
MTEPVRPDPTPPVVSVVSTLYKSRAYLPQFLDQCIDALQAANVESFEIILVNDGSPDDSLAFALKRQRDIPQLVVLDLSRNFGHHHALQAGMVHARGQLVFLIDCDLEVSPSVFSAFYSKILETGCDLVYGYQEFRKGGLFERSSGGLFWKGFNLLSEIRVPENMTTERIMSRRFVDALLQLGDRNLFLGGMMTWTGFDQIGIAVPKGLRDGTSTYTLMKRVRLMVNAVSSFSSRPLVLLFNFGISITGLSIAYVAYLLLRKLMFDDTLIGFTSVMALVALNLGILTTSIGLVGIYLSKVFNQVQARPNFIVKQIYR